MKIKYLLSAAALSAAFSLGLNLRAATAYATQNLGGSATGQYQVQAVAFSDSAEAGMLHRAYRILASGDHDYKGHRVKAMHQIEAAAKLLNVDLSGDLKDRQSQVLSDAKLRDAQGLLQNVLGAAEVKSQPRISKHVANAINELNTALSVR